MGSHNRNVKSLPVSTQEVPTQPAITAARAPYNPASGPGTAKPEFRNTGITGSVYDTGRLGRDQTLAGFRMFRIAVSTKLSFHDRGNDFEGMALLWEIRLPSGIA